MSKINDWLSASYPKEHYTPGFGRILLAYKHFNIGLSQLKVITVAGTNGKGTVSNLLLENLKLNNKEVSLFNSPHLFSILERFKFSHVKLTEESLLSFFINTHNELLSKEIYLSFYEFTLIVFLRLSLKYKVDHIILEVGLGGRLDATNIVDADIALITSISRDHVDLLGNRYDDILFEKLGVIKKKTKAFASFELDYLIQKTNEFGIKNNLNVCVKKDSNDLLKRNSFLLDSALKDLGLRTFCYKISRVSLEGNFLYSCSHNLAAVRNLVNSLKEKPVKIQGSLLILSYSHRDIKELEYMSKLFLELKPFVKSIYLTHIDQFKAAKVEDLQFISKKLNISFMDEENLKDAIKINKKIYLSGSNYFIGNFINKFK